MDDTQKSRVRLSHWIDHNLEHLKGYAEVAKLLESQGVTEAAQHVRQGMQHMEDANKEFEKAVALLPGGDAKTGQDKEHGHTAHSHPGHSHGHKHTPDDDHHHEH